MESSGRKTRILVKAGFIYILISSFAISQEGDNRLARIVSHLQKFVNEYPQQKVYLQLDKTRYNAGEDIWYKAYLVNGTTHLPDTMSTNLYVELVNARNFTVQTRILRLNNGFAHGDFMLKDTVTEGNYLIKAYTSWMTNFDQGFIFRKNLYIRNPDNKNFISREDIRFNKRFNRKHGRLNDKKDIQFLPEGGYLVNNIRSRVAFKAVNGTGKGIMAEGKIKDQKDKEIAIMQTIHAGMGAFSFVPEAGKTYYAWVRLAGEEEKKYKLPQPLEKGITLNIDNLSSEDFIKLIIRSNLPPSLDEYARDIILVAQASGNICYSSVLKMNSDSLILNIPKEKFPTGIAQITLFNGRSVPVAERLIFVNHHDPLILHVSEADDTLKRPDRLNLKLKATNGKGQPVEGNFSISATDASQAEENSEEYNIMNTLWLTSDIKGTVESPGYYFSSGSPDREVALDLLMMTQGWRRFDWNKLLAEQYPRIYAPEEKGIVISGKITRDFFLIPVKIAPVYLTILSSYNDYFSSVTDDKGRFRFENLVYYDTLSVVVEATKPNGRKNVQIILDLAQSPVANVQSGEVSEQQVLAKGEDWKYARVKRPDYGEKDRERKKKMEKYAPFRIHSEADNVIYMEDIPDGYTDLFQVIQGRVPGVQVEGSSIHIRGINTFFGSTDPLFLVDGVPVDIATFRSINPKDVEFIEFLKGPNAAIYGLRGSNGVIAVYTKRGDFMKRGYLDFKMLAYYTPREFYVPVSGKGLQNKQPAIPSATVYWKPEIITNSSGEAKFFFRKPENTRVRIVIEGISLRGIPGYTESLINR